MCSPWGHTSVYTAPIRAPSALSPPLLPQLPSDTFALFIPTTCLQPMDFLVSSLHPCPYYLARSAQSTPHRANTSYPCLQLAHSVLWWVDWIWWTVSQFPTIFLHKPAARGLVCLLPASCWAHSSTLKMEATCSSQTSLNLLYSTQHYTPEVGTLQHKCKFYSERIMWTYSKPLQNMGKGTHVTTTELRMDKQ
jgi:hypothetical protein